MRKKEYIIYIGIPLVILLLDRLTKSAALSFLYYRDITLFFWLKLSLAFNRGISWSMLSFNAPFLYNLLTGFILCIIALFGVYVYARKKNGYNIYAELCIIGGAVSNIFDRIYYGSVIDFIACSYKNFEWPSFNVADIAIVLGTVVCIWSILDETYFSKNR